MHAHSIAALALGLAAAASAQPQALWLDQFGTTSDEYVHGAAPDAAGGIYTVGHTFGSLAAPISGPTDAFLARHDAAGNFLWARQLGTTKTEYGYAAAPDGAGGVYIAGSTSGVLNAPSGGSFDAFVARYDAQGNLLWARQFGSTSWDFAFAAATDGAGGVFIAGSVLGPVDGQPYAGVEDIFLARYDADGNRLALRVFGTSAHDQALGLATDTAGGVFVTGTTKGPLAPPHKGTYDVFVVRCDGAAAELWVRQIGTAQSDAAQAATPDGEGGVFIAGYTAGILGPFGNGRSDGFVARYTAAGDKLWLTQVGSPSADSAYAVAPDGEGGAFVSGYTMGPLGGPFKGAFDGYLARLDANGNQTDAVQIGTPGFDYTYALVNAGPGRVFVAGYTNGALEAPNIGFHDAYTALFGEPCIPDCEADGDLDIDDFICYQTLFALGDGAADCEQDGDLDIDDFICFQTLFAIGCP